MASIYMEDAIKYHPKSLIYLDLLGKIYTEQGKAKRAKKTYQKAIKEAKKQGKDAKEFEVKNAALNN